MRSLRGERRAAAVTAAALALAITLAAISASAADTEPIRLRFEAPPDCPGEAAFLDQVRARTAKARVAATAEKARTFAVRLTQEGQKVLGRLAIEDAASQTEIREVTGERCAEVVSALALITALAVDPHASTAPPARLPAAPLPPPPPAIGSDPSAPGPSSTLAPPPRARLPPDHPAPYSRPPSWADLDVWPLPVIPQLPAEIPSRWRFTAGVEVAAVGGFAPAIVPGSALFVEATLTDPRAFAFAPSIRLTAIEAVGGYVGPAPIVARFQLHTARAEVCPMRLVLAEGLAIAPCAWFEVGSLFAEGWGSVASGSSDRPWAAPGFGGRFRWTIAGEIELQIEGSAALPLVRDTFFVAPVTVVHAVPGLAGSLAGGVGVHFY